MSNAASSIDLTTVHESPASPEAWVQTIETLLEKELFAAAKTMAARAVVAFPNHARLSQTNRVLNPSKVTSQSATRPDRSQEFEWLRRNSHEYRGQWVALLGGDLIASSPKVEEVLGELRVQNLEERSLVHRVD